MRPARTTARVPSASSATGPVESLRSAWRFSVQKFKSDGFRDDAFLGRDDTQQSRRADARASSGASRSRRTRDSTSRCITSISTTVTTAGPSTTRGARRPIGPASTRRRRQPRSARFTSTVMDTGKLTVDRRVRRFEERQQLRRRLGQRAALGSIHVRLLRMVGAGSPHRQSRSAPRIRRADVAWRCCVARWRIRSATARRWARYERGHLCGPVLS